MNHNPLYFYILVILFLIPISGCWFMDQNTQLAFAAFHGDLEKIKKLVAAGADPNYKAEDGSTALHTAAAGGHIEVVKFLLAKGADVNAKKDNGQTPLHFAVFVGNKDMAEFLISKGADKDAKDIHGKTPFTAQKEMLDVLNSKQSTEPS